MKNCPALVLLLFLFGTGLSKAQNFAGFPDSSARWFNTELQTPISSGNSQLLSEEDLFITIADTVIQGKRYQLLFRQNGLQVITEGAFRTDSGRFYFRPGLQDSLRFPSLDSNEYLVYDFNLQVGDSVKDLYYVEDFRSGRMRKWGTDFASNSVISQVDTLTTARGLVRAFYIDGSPFFADGIGSYTGFLKGPYASLSQHFSQINCFSEKGLTYFSNLNFLPVPQQGDQCEAYLNIEREMDLSFAVFPNPGEGWVQFTNHEPGLLQIYQSNGRLLKSVKIMVRDQLDLSDLPSGLYYFNFAGQHLRWIKP